MWLVQAEGCCQSELAGGSWDSLGLQQDSHSARGLGLDTPCMGVDLDSWRPPLDCDDGSLPSLSAEHLRGVLPASPPCGFISPTSLCPFYR